VIGAKGLLADRQRPLVERPRACEVSLLVSEAGEVVEAPRGIRLLGAEGLLVDRQRPLVERPRACEIALALQQESEVVEARWLSKNAPNQTPFHGYPARAR
jgi:hypothetical protein